MASSLDIRGILFWAAFPFLLVIYAAYLFRPGTDSGHPQCAALSAVLGEKISYPSSEGAYAQSSNAYWSQQESSLTPSCIVSPTDTGDVVVAVRTLGLANKKNGALKAKFAIRGGGHTPWAGSANIDDGVTIDMRSIRQITVNEDKTIVSVGAGAIWGDVYQRMDALGLAVVGGRGSTIGVGGLLTGGNIRG